MKLKISLTLAAASLAIGGVANAATFTATSDTFGYVTVEAIGNGFTFVSFPMQATPSATGSISVSGNDLTISNFSVAPGTFSATNPAFAEVVAGSNVGARSDVVSNSVTGVTVVDASMFANGDVVEIKLHNTLGSVFGDTTGTLLINGGSNGGVADNVLIFNTGTQSFETFFFNTNPTLGGWRSTLNPVVDESNTIIPPNAGVAVLNRSVSPVELIQSGRVQANEAELNLVSGFSSQASNFPANATLAEALGSTTGTLQIQGGANGGVADNVLVFNTATQSFETFFFNTSPDPVLGGWRSTLNPVVDESDQQAFGPGISTLILRRAGDIDLVESEPSGL